MMATRARKPRATNALAITCAAEAAPAPLPLPSDMPNHRLCCWTRHHPCGQQQQEDILYCCDATRNLRSIAAWPSMRKARRLIKQATLTATSLVLPGTVSLEAIESRACGHERNTCPGSLGAACKDRMSY